jgi:hypothetical protein
MADTARVALFKRLASRAFKVEQSCASTPTEQLLAVRLRALMVLALAAKAPASAQLLAVA